MLLLLLLVDHFGRPFTHGILLTITKGWHVLQLAAIMAKISHFTKRMRSSRKLQIDLLSQAQSESLRSRLDPLDRE